MGEALSLLALCHAGGAGPAARCGAGTSGHRGGVGPPCGPRGPPSASPHAEGPDLLGGKALGGQAEDWGGPAGSQGEAPLSGGPCSLPQGLSPGLRREAWKFLLGYLSWEGSAEEHKAHVRKKT